MLVSVVLYKVPEKIAGFANLVAVQLWYLIALFLR